MLHRGSICVNKDGNGNKVVPISVVVQKSNKVNLLTRESVSIVILIGSGRETVQSTSQEEECL